MPRFAISSTVHGPRSACAGLAVRRIHDRPGEAVEQLGHHPGGIRVQAIGDFVEQQ